MFGSQNLTTVKLKGVGESFRKYPNHESKGIKAHFNLDESGVLSLDRVRAGMPAGPSPPAFLEYEKREGFRVTLNEVNQAGMWCSLSYSL